MARAAFNPTHYLSDTADNGWSGPVEVVTDHPGFLAALHDGEAACRNADGQHIIAHTGQLIGLAGHAHTEAWNVPFTVQDGDREATVCELCRRPIMREIIGERGEWGSWHLVDEVEAFVDQLARPADPLVDATAERDRLARDVEALTAERDGLTRLLIAAGRDRDNHRARADLTRDELTRTTRERDDARRQRDQLTDQLDAALDDRDKARAELRDARAELRIELEGHRVTCDRHADTQHHADGLRMALAALLDAPAEPGPAALALIGRLGPGGRWTGAALTAHSAGHYGKAIRLAARGILHRHDDGDQGETLGEVAAELLDDQVDDHRDQVAAAWSATVSTAPATLSTGSGTARA